ncbi:transporter substrate-binding domain-containing protein [Curvibacter sp. APW13]|uniref:substrate-binding periplasmic protein n=1 Tax=Curvibacter sp. APW13 TaxID=3077236 RepID=UPI0028DE8984|nr:transporter substrate-binding domain-containing protein [Curvibacter sp. APW13]MDT8990458.1 transporter substrate-binding domain-containing protein [Curvibacter sp. APW13]
MYLVRVLSSVLLLLAPTAWACSLNIAYSDVASPPHLMGDGAAIPEQPGIAVELVQHAADALHCSVKWQRLPNRRVQRDMEMGVLDAMLMFSYNDERAAYAVYPMKDGKPDGRLRLAELRYHVYVADNSPLVWNGKQFDPLPATVGVNAGYSILADLKKMGLVVEEARSTEQNFQKLRLGRIDAYVAQDAPADLAIETMNLRGVRKLPIAFSSKDYFLPFSKAFYGSTPEVAERMWEQIGKASRSRLKELTKKYGDSH